MSDVHSFPRTPSPPSYPTTGSNILMGRSSYQLFLSTRSRIIRVFNLPKHPAPHLIALFQPPHTPVSLWTLREEWGGQPPASEQFIWAVFRTHEQAVTALSLTGGSVSIATALESDIEPFKKLRKVDLTSRAMQPPASFFRASSMMSSTTMITPGSQRWSPTSTVPAPSPLAFPLSSNPPNPRHTFRPGDWICIVPACGAHNFMRNYTCIGCQAPRPPNTMPLYFPSVPSAALGGYYPRPPIPIAPRFLLDGPPLSEYTKFDDANTPPRYAERAPVTVFNSFSSLGSYNGAGTGAGAGSMPVVARPELKLDHTSSTRGGDLNSNQIVAASRTSLSDVTLSLLPPPPSFNSSTSYAAAYGSAQAATTPSTTMALQNQLPPAPPPPPFSSSLSCNFDPGPPFTALSPLGYPSAVNTAMMSGMPNHLSGSIYPASLPKSSGVLATLHINRLPYILTPSGRTRAINVRPRNVSTDMFNPCIILWPENELFPLQGQIRPLPLDTMGMGAPQLPPIMNTGNKGPIALQPGDWLCSECKYVNWRRRRVCETCYPYADGNSDGVSASVQAERITVAQRLLTATSTPINLTSVGATIPQISTNFSTSSKSSLSGSDRGLNLASNATSTTVLPSISSQPSPPPPGWINTLGGIELPFSNPTHLQNGALIPHATFGPSQQPPPPPDIFYRGYAQSASQGSIASSASTGVGIGSATAGTHANTLTSLNFACLPDYTTQLEEPRENDRHHGPPRLLPSFFASQGGGDGLSDILVPESDTKLDIDGALGNFTTFHHAQAHSPVGDTNRCGGGVQTRRSTSTPSPRTPCTSIGSKSPSSTRDVVRDARDLGMTMPLRRDSSLSSSESPSRSSTRSLVSITSPTTGSTPSLPRPTGGHGPGATRSIWAPMKNEELLETSVLPGVCSHATAVHMHMHNALSAAAAAAKVVNAALLR